jgi:hypothetical protein
MKEQQKLHPVKTLLCDECDVVEICRTLCIEQGGPDPKPIPSPAGAKRIAMAHALESIPHESAVRKMKGVKKNADFLFPLLEEIIEDPQIYHFLHMQKYFHLENRDKIVLAALALGKSNREISDLLGLSETKALEKIHLTKLERKVVTLLGVGLPREDTRQLLRISTVSLRISLLKIRKKLTLFTMDVG